MAGPAQEDHQRPHSSEQRVLRHALNPFTSDTGSAIIVTGRSITVKKDLTGTSVATAYSALASRIWRNKVRQDYMANMRHEKKGVKRRRLSSERWRRRFADHVCSASQQAIPWCSLLPSRSIGQAKGPARQRDPTTRRLSAHPFMWYSTIRTPTVIFLPPVDHAQAVNF